MKLTAAHDALRSRETVAASLGPFRTLHIWCCFLAARALSRASLIICKRFISASVFHYVLHFLWPGPAKEVLPRVPHGLLVIVLGYEGGERLDGPVRELCLLHRLGRRGSAPLQHGLELLFVPLGPS